MVRGLYTSTTGMLVQEIRMDLVSNNLANVNTAGYKGDASAIKSFPQMLVHRINDTYLKVTGVEGNMDLRPMIGLSTFGAVVDETMKKGELQITVVATGFDADRVSESPMEKMSRMTIDYRNKKDREKEAESKITYPEKFESKMIIEEKVSPKPQRKSVLGKSEDEMLDDDDLEIPAFIRRKMGK